MRIISRKLCRFLLMFLTGFTSINVLLLFPLLITFLFMHGFLMFIIRASWPFLVELIDLATCVIFFLTHITLLRWLTFLLGSLTVALSILLFWTYFFLLRLVFVLQWLSLYWEILIIFLSQFSRTFLQTRNGMCCFIT